MGVPHDWTTGTVDSDGSSLQYYRTGDGRPVVMAHGFTDNGRCWGRLFSDLATEYDVIAYDARAHGRSDAPESGYGIENRVADLVSIVDALGLDDPILFGHSMGGNTAASAASMYPDIPRAVVLEDPAGMLEMGDETHDERAASVLENVREWSNRSVRDIAAEYAETRPNLARRLAVARTECRPEIAKIVRAGFPRAENSFPDITAPTLVLKADADPQRRAQDIEVAAALPNGRLVHVPDAGHCVFRDQYAAAAAELRGFLRWVSLTPTA